MRIIYLHQYFNTPDMVGSTRSFEVGRRLVAAGHEVEIITTWREPSEIKHWFTTDVSGMRVHWLPVQYSNYLSYGSRMRAFAKFATAAARRAASMEADVVFATSTPLTIALPATFVSRRKRIPMVLEVRDLWPDMPIAIGALRNPVSRAAARWLERFSYASAARVIALSPAMAAGVARAGYPPSRIAIVPNAADLELVKRDPARGRAFRMKVGIGIEKILIAYVGTLGRVNGVGYLVHVAAALRDDERFAFLTVGDGYERDHVEALARKHAVLNRNFFMHPVLAKREVAAALSAADIATSLFLPIREMEANSANKFFDGLAAGCCVAVNYGGWQADLLTSADAGVRLPCEPGNAARELQHLADNRSHIQIAGQNARRLAESRFSRDQLAKQIEAVISAAVNDDSRHGQ